MFASYFWQCWDLLHTNPSTDEEMTPMPTYFRFLTLMALKVFVSGFPYFLLLMLMLLMMMKGRGGVDTASLLEGGSGLCTICR